MTVKELIAYLQTQDENRRVVVADQDGAGSAEDIHNVDQRVDKGESVIAIWYHK